MKVLGWGHLQEIGRVPPPEFAMPRVAPAARDELQLLAAELARGAKHIKGAYWATEAEWARAESGEEIGITLDDRLACDLEHGGVKMQFNRSCQSMTMCDMGSLELFCRIGSGAPFHLFQVGGGEFRTDGDEATPAQYKRLMKKLGLKHSTAADFLALVLAIACPTPLAWASEHRSEDDEYFDVEGEGEGMRVLAEALTMLVDTTNLYAWRTSPPAANGTARADTRVKWRRVEALGAALVIDRCAGGNINMQSVVLEFLEAK